MKNLKVQNRHAGIVAALRQHGNLAVSELAAMLDVSEETIRRDAALLEESGEVSKMHGALALPHNMTAQTFERRMREAAPEKLSIARTALQLVRDGDSLMIDTGTTTTFFARELRQRRNLTVITNSTEIARTLVDVPGNKIFLSGGELEINSGATYGLATVEFMSRFQVKHGFLSINALDLRLGPMDSTTDEADFARVVLRCSTHHAILVDSTKFSAQSFVKVCDYSDIDVIVTEKSPSPEFFQVLNAAGTKLLISN